MKTYTYTLERDHYGQDSEGRETTLGRLTRPDGTRFGYVLEDVVRAHGIKSKGKTAIPYTERGDPYNIKVMMSPKYGKVATVFTHMENGVPILENGGIKFSYIRCHGGNNADHTEGCLLVNKNRTTTRGKMGAWGSLKNEFSEEVERLEREGFSVKLKVVNLSQES